MGVHIAPNLKRTKEMIDPNGNIINPETKEVVQKNEVGYVPTKEEVESKVNLPAEPVKVPDEVKQGGFSGGIESAIQQKVNEAVVNAIGKLDIGKMVEKAVEEAFK